MTKVSAGLSQLARRWETIRVNCSIEKKNGCRVSELGIDSVVANETSADWRRVVTLVYPAFALPVSDECDGG